MIYLDAGTTYSKIITSEKNFDEVFLVDKKDENRFGLLSKLTKKFKGE